MRKAAGSDNWPTTWGDDDAIYTAYGDGNGFEPLLPEKLGLGFAKIMGSPTSFEGINIRSTTGENTGSGARGKKASGLLMVEGVLYMWVRNAGNAQLAWSKDHAKTWTWSDWKLTASFGHPTFLNFGKNYAVPATITCTSTLRTWRAPICRRAEWCSHAFQRTDPRPLRLRVFREVR